MDWIQLAESSVGRREVIFDRSSSVRASGVLEAENFIVGCRYFFLVNDSVDNDAAIERCRSIGAYLAIIENYEEQCLIDHQVEIWRKYKVHFQFSYWMHNLPVVTIEIKMSETGPKLSAHWLVSLERIWFKEPEEVNITRMWMSGYVNPNVNLSDRKFIIWTNGTGLSRFEFQVQSLSKHQLSHWSYPITLSPVPLRCW